VCRLCISDLSCLFGFRDGAIGGLGQAVAEAVSGKAEETKKDNQK
jgi:hypothetical protein